MKKATAATIAFFYLVWSCAAVQLHEEGDSVVELRCSATPRRRRFCCGAAL